MIDKLMIVAHPDDEALFGGAELLTHSKEYKVIAVDEYHNHIRTCFYYFNMHGTLFQSTGMLMFLFRIVIDL